jgi:hypothetical protein
LAIRNEAEYQRVCASLVAAFGDDEIASNRLSVVDLCIASPNSSVDPNKLLAMARDPRAVEGALPSTRTDFYIGVCLLRHGQHEEAARLISQYIEAAPSGPDERGHGDLAYAKSFLALARCGLGHRSQAERLLAEANEHASKAGDFQWNWRLRIDLEMLRSEVQDLLCR